ncbi:aminobenzoate synthetase [Microbacterium sp. CH12i]|uniref:aminobenzoate synthetase n=1 Tax=Microbacterium sp. CH12i TaxID=1479651 RepID=UPI000460CE2B|nr:aminobenzoate synthetase [Microbacterium sp. CH12i]KDA05515.1 aminobenzoate synthetase [Microbacterium sp. CH12i]
MPSKSSDPVAQALRGATARIIDAVVEVSVGNPVVLIDGRAGAGKSTLARLVAANWPFTGTPQLIALDSLYPGWDGLDAGAERALHDILRPHARGLLSTWRRWDWEHEVEAEAHAVAPALGVILEGCGALNPATARIADVRVWVESPEASRKRRALERDGDDFRPHWDRWAAQEARHIERDDPRAHATLQVTIP